MNLGYLGLLEGVYGCIGVEFFISRQMVEFTGVQTGVPGTIECN